MPGRGGNPLFSGRYVWLGFPNLGACERINCRESGGLWADFHQKQWLDIYQISSFWWKSGRNWSFVVKNYHIFWNLLILEARFYIYLSNEGLVNGLKLQLESCERQEKCEKGVFPYPLFSWVPPPESMPTLRYDVQCAAHDWFKLESPELATRSLPTFQFGSGQVNLSISSFMYV